eukprot:5849312-Alexandrium_andersonii.AAC.1
MASETQARPYTTQPRLSACLLRGVHEPGMMCFGVLGRRSTWTKLRKAFGLTRLTRLTWPANHDEALTNHHMTMKHVHTDTRAHACNNPNVLTEAHAHNRACKMLPIGAPPGSSWGIEPRQAQGLAIPSMA